MKCYIHTEQNDNINTECKDDANKQRNAFWNEAIKIPPEFQSMKDQD